MSAPVSLLHLSDGRSECMLCAGYSATPHGEGASNERRPASLAQHGSLSRSLPALRALGDQRRGQDSALHRLGPSGLVLCVLLRASA